MTNRPALSLEGYRAVKYIDGFYDVLSHTTASDRAGAQLDLEPAFEQISLEMAGLKAGPGKVMLIGNGGSAAIASHVQNDICKAAGVPALVFTETSLLTALSNDDGYETAFDYQVGLFARSGDILIVISSSGKSENLLRASRTGAAKGCFVMTLTGFSADNPLKRLGDLNVYVPSSHYGYVESAHAVLLHAVTDRAVAILKERGESR